LRLTWALRGALNGTEGLHAEAGDRDAAGGRGTLGSRSRATTSILRIRQYPWALPAARSPPSAPLLIAARTTALRRPRLTDNRTSRAFRDQQSRRHVRSARTLAGRAQYFPSSASFRINRRQFRHRLLQPLVLPLKLLQTPRLVDRQSTATGVEEGWQVLAGKRQAALADLAVGEAESPTTSCRTGQKMNCRSACCV
jgi:hypothetical protein